MKSSASGWFLLGILCGVSHPGVSLDCFVAPPGGREVIQRCPPTSRGCTKLDFYTAGGNVRTSKLCGEEEIFGFTYHEGCKKTSIPFTQEECYCKRDLCNGAALSSAVNLTLLSLWFLLFCLTRTSS